MKELIAILVGVLAVSCSSKKTGDTTTVKMRDGVSLSTLVLFPKKKQEKYPVVLIRTPYKKERRIEKYSYILDHEYVLVIQDVRGRFGSGGKFQPYINEAKDGYDAVEWIAKQTWCDGNIGMIGASYNGSVQYCAAAEQPPHLKTIIPSVGSADLFYDGQYVKGVFRPGRLMWCAIIEAIAPDEEIFSKNWEQLLNHSPVSDLDSIVIGKKLDYYQEWIAHDSKDDYWKQSIHRELLKNIKIPVFTQTGWFDTHLRSSALVYDELTKAGNQNVKMIIGPWGHTDQESKFYNDEFMGEAADDISLQDQYTRWFDYWLKGEHNGIMDEPLVQLYAINANKWYHSNTYPFPFTTGTKFYLSSKGRPDLQTNHGELVAEPGLVIERVDSFTYNPSMAPVYSMEMLERGGYDSTRKMLKDREDYLFFKTATLEDETTIIGPITARIYASTSAPDTDWFLILVALDEADQFVDLVSIGIFRAKFRSSLSNPEFVHNEVAPYDFEMDPYGIALSRGHKLGLIVTSSFGYPFLARNLNTGKNNQIETDYQVAKQKIYHTNEYRSYISIPVLNEHIDDQR